MVSKTLSLPYLKIYNVSKKYSLITISIIKKICMISTMEKILISLMAEFLKQTLVAIIVTKAIKS